MLYRRTTLLSVAASVLILACADAPVAPRAASISPVDDAAVASVRNGNKHRATLTAVAQQTIAGNVIDAVVSVTRLSLSDDGKLLASGTISGTANGAQFTQSFTDVPADLAQASVGMMQGGAGSCSILSLDLGPLFLDILGLVVDLEPVILDIFAQTGAGNLLGNLLCAITGLFDGVAVLAAIGNLLDQINAIIGALGG
jgi:hypothetical protein